MNTIEVTLKGQTPLMLHNIRLADPLDPYTVALKEVTSKRKKTDADHESIARIEWEGGLYYDPSVGPYIPGWNIIRSLRDGAALSKRGKDIIRAVVCDSVVPIIYDGPRDLDGMWAAGFRDRRAVGVGTARTIRTRPKFENWRLQVTFEHEEEVISERDLLSAVVAAGRYCGLGEYRPSSPKGGQFGRFTIEKINGKAVDKAA